MSKLRICNNDRQPFGEDEPGWAEGNFVFHNQYDDGSPNDVTKKVDLCPEHGTELLQSSRRHVQFGRSADPSRTLTSGHSSAQAAPAGKRLVDDVEYAAYMSYLESQRVTDQTVRGDRPVGGYYQGGDYPSAPDEQALGRE